MKIIDYKSAMNIKPSIKFIMEVISTTMKNPEEFITKGSWTIVDEQLEKSRELIKPLTEDEADFALYWIINCLNASGWSLSDDYSKIIPLSTVEEYER